VPGCERNDTLSEAEDLDRLRASFAARTGTAANGCPDADRLWRAVIGELPPADRRVLVAHTAECPACAGAWRLGREMAPRSPAGTATGRRWPPLAWPVAAALVVAGGLFLYTRPVGERPVYREPSAQAVRSLVPEDAPIPRGAFVLRWSGPEGARYDLSVLAEGLQPVHTARDLATTEHQVPEEALTGVPSGARLFWQVEVKPPEGGSYRSPTFLARLE
jgi:anti-sigma factor RsiW